MHGWNKRALTVWCSIGADIENGEWAIYGARLGCYLLYFEDWDHNVISDFDWIESFWERASKDYPKPLEIVGCLKELGLDIAEIDAEQSKFFKSVLPEMIKDK